MLLIPTLTTPQHGIVPRFQGLSVEGTALIASLGVLHVPIITPTPAHASTNDGNFRGMILYMVMTVT